MPDVAISWYDVSSIVAPKEMAGTKIVASTAHFAFRQILPGDCHGPLGLAMTRLVGLVAPI